MADDPGDRAAADTDLPAGSGEALPPAGSGAPSMVALTRRPGTRRPGTRHGLRPPTPAASPSTPSTTPPARAASPAPATPAVSPSPPTGPAVSPAPAAPRASAPRGPDRDRRDRDQPDRDEPDLAWAATSTLLADLGARLAARRRPWTRLRVLRAATATAAAAVVLMLGVAWGATSWVQAAIREIGALDPDSASIVDAAAQAGDQNYLVIGSDTRIGATPEEAVGDESGIPGARSDTVMIVHVPADRSAVTAVSFPRDLEIDRPACERWDPTTGAYLGTTAPEQPRAKLNTAYQVGGPRCVTKVVQALSGLAINHFLGIDFQGFKGMVDAVGGVGVCLERPLRDAVLGDVVDRAGPTVLSGDQALSFVRARHVLGDPTSDYGRIERQQRFLSALLREIVSAGTLLDLGKLRGLVAAVSSSTFGDNVGGDQLLALGRSLGGIDTHDVVFTTVPTTGVANGRGNEVLRSAENRDLFLAVIDHRPLPGTPAAPAAPAPAAVTPQQVTLRLVDARTGATTLAGSALGPRNGTGSGSAGVPGYYGGSGSGGPNPDDSDGSDGSGQGSDDGGSDDERSGFRRAAPAASPAAVSVASVASALRARGFRVVVGDSGAAVAGSSTTAVRFSPDQQAAAATLSRAVPGAALSPTGGAGILDLVVGDGFDGSVVDPTSPVTPVAPTVTAADTACS